MTEPQIELLHLLNINSLRSYDGPSVVFPAIQSNLLCLLLGESHHQIPFCFDLLPTPIVSAGTIMEHTDMPSSEVSMTS